MANTSGVVVAGTTAGVAASTFRAIVNTFGADHHRAAIAFRGIPIYILSINNFGMGYMEIEYGKQYY